MRVAWVHPTWRDLVIDRLAEDRALRRHFLRRAGVHGVLLALSTAGGAGGERRLPLVGSDEDWDVIGDRLYALIPELEEPELIAVLAAIEVTLADLDEVEDVGEARALARLALARTAQTWETAHQPIALAALDAWLTLSARLAPRMAPPPLAVTWAELLPARAPHPADQAEVQRFADWLVLCQMLWEFSPQLPAALGFGEQEDRTIVAFLNAVQGWGTEPSDAVLRALNAVTALNAGLASRATALARRLRDDRPPSAWVVGESPPNAELDPIDAAGSIVERVLADL
jgi:hypothetical protein